MANKNKSKWAFGAILAAVAGYFMGILTAPKSGQATRKDIKKSASKAKTEAEKKLKTLQTELNDALKHGKKITENLKSTAKKDLEKVIKSGNKAKEKARDVLSSVHEGDADDDELDKAIKEANQALKHLKTYIKK